MATPTVAANAYASIGRILDPGMAGKSSDASGPSFGDLLKDVIGDVVDGGRKADAQTASMASGKANVMDVVTAVAETDVKVSTLGWVRTEVSRAEEHIRKVQF